MNKFYGTGVAMVTPFNTDGTVDYDALKKLINYLIEGGVQYLVSLGTTGETSVLGSEEKKDIWKFTAETVAGRLPLIAGIGGNNTAEVVSSLKNFDINGYDAILSVCPYYNKPSQEGIYQHYKAVAESSPLPVILYNVPGRTVTNISAEIILRLAHDFQNIIAVKEASGNFEQINRILKEKPKDFLLISGDDLLTLPLIACGAAGVISVVSNALPKHFSEMVQLCLNGDFKSARIQHLDLLNMMNLFFSEGSPGGVKAALKELGICRDTLRLPLVNVSKSTHSGISSELLRLKLIRS